MRRLLASFCTATLLLAVSACGDDADRGNNGESANDAEPTHSLSHSDIDSPVISHLGQLQDKPAPTTVVVPASTGGTEVKLPLPVTLDDLLEGFSSNSSDYDSLEEYIAAGPTDERVSMCEEGACIRVYLPQTMTVDNPAFQTIFELPAFQPAGSEFAFDDLEGTLAVFDELGKPDQAFFTSSSEESGEYSVTVTTWNLRDDHILAMVVMHLEDEGATLTEISSMPLSLYDSYFYDHFVARYDLSEIDLS